MDKKIGFPADQKEIKNDFKYSKSFYFPMLYLYYALGIPNKPTICSFFTNHSVEKYVFFLLSRDFSPSGPCGAEICFRCELRARPQIQPWDFFRCELSARPEKHPPNNFPA